jgi:hypothetical protein
MRYIAGAQAVIFCQVVALQWITGVSGAIAVLLLPHMLWKKTLYCLWAPRYWVLICPCCREAVFVAEDRRMNGY